MDWSKNDYRYMARAIQLAQRASFHVHPNPKVGCVLSKDGNIVAEGWHHAAGDDHAELVAIRKAGAGARETSCYISLEPCSHSGKTPPCVDALIDAGVAQVIIPMPDPNPDVSGQGIRRLEQAGIKVRTGLMQAEAEQLNRGFLKRMRTGLPYVRCKLAQSLDGRTALANGTSKWITTENSRRNVHELRAASSAILTGVNTVVADDPSLTVRHIDSAGYQPLRVVLDSQLRINTDARILKQPGRCIIFTVRDGDDKSSALERAGVEVIQCTGINGRVDLNAAFEHLAAGYEINDVLIEAGPTLSGSLLEQKLVDEIVLYIAPKLLGQTGRELFTLSGFTGMRESPALTVRDIRRIGEDVRIIAVPLNTNETGET
ncbi:MAG: bifunctional diaminohydroxyphosphoribosylaminopyrimidine deaminase/5-amino-6-(5-phosphoribosylamino)uracil reductase RibD [Thiotrichales bacterium]|nr:bifunctional diaminohydroxyphosphoribosylaminopyrimidine deaminase/5-amino-6-(5-phosphoribosylamino)uracil reductase RibD [Thiotrichales bacterium]